MGKLILKIDGNDVTDEFADSTTSPAGPGIIGRAVINLNQEGGGLDVRPLSVVEHYFAFNVAGAGVEARGRLFGGLVATRDTGNVGTTKLWSIPCQDYNMLLTTIVRDAAPARYISLSAGTFAAQVLALTQQLQRNGHATVAIAIDASTYVADLHPTMPAVTLEPGHTYGWYLQALCATAKGLNPALLPRFFIGLSDSFSVGDIFGPPCLRIYDQAVPGTAAFTFDEDNIEGTFQRIEETTSLYQRRQAIFPSSGAVATYEETTSQATYPNPYINHNGAPDNDGFWMAEPVVDKDSATFAEAEAKLQRMVEGVAYPRETIRFSTKERVFPGETVEITWSLEGMSGELKRVVAVSRRIVPPNSVESQIVLNARRLRIGEKDTDSFNDPPTEGDVIPPPTPTWAADPLWVLQNVYNPATNRVTMQVECLHDPPADMDFYRWYWKVASNPPQMLDLETRQLTITDVPPNTVVSFKVDAFDTHGNHYGWSAENGWTSAGPTPTNGFYNGSREIPGSDPTLPDGSTFTGDANPVLVDTPVRDGVRALAVIQTGAETLSELMTPMLVVEGNLYQAIGSALWNEDTLSGTGVLLDWQDETGAVIQTDPAFSFAGDAVADYEDQVSEQFIAPVGVVMVQMRIEYQLHMGVSPLTTYVDRLNIVDDTTQIDLPGSVKQSLHDKLHETLSVTDFGAVGDGTTDDTDALQKAIDAARVGTLGRTLLVPDGEYLVSATLDIDSVQGFVMKGEGHSARFVWDGNTTTPMFDIVDSRNYELRDFQIISTTGAQLSVGIQVRRSGASPTVVPRMGTFRNIFMQGTDGGLDTGYIIGGASHYDANTDFNTFENCEINNYKFYGWAISGSQLYGNTFHNCNAFGFTGALSAVWITSSGGYFTWKGGVVYSNAIDFHNEATTHTTYQPMLIEGVVSENSEKFVDWQTKGHLEVANCRWSGNVANNGVQFLRVAGGGSFLVHDCLFGDGFAGTGANGLGIEIPDEETRLTFHSNTLVQDSPYTMSQLWLTYGPDEEWNNRWMDESTVQYTPLTEHSTGFADGDATPDVMGHRLYYTVNTGATTITDITFLHASKAKAGKQITILFTDALTTLAHNTHIKLAGAANRTFAANDMVELFWGGTYWIQVSGSAGGAIPDGVLPRYARAATTLSITLSGTQTADGVALIAGDKCLVRVQSTGSQNGLYVVSAGAWTRATDSDTSAKMPSGSLFQVTEGTVNGDALFAITTNNPIVLGTTALTFTRLTRKHTSITAGTYNRVTVDDFGQVTAGFTNRGGTLPGSPTTGDEFFYTGAGKNVWVYYDGTRWLGPEFLYAWHDYVISPQPYTANTNPHIAGLPQDYALYMKRLDIAWYEVTGDASNYWTIEVWKLAGGGATKVATTTTAAGAGPWTLNSNVAFVGGTNPLTLGDFLLYTEIAKTGSPGNLYYTITLFAQKIFT